MLFSWRALLLLALLFYLSVPARAAGVLAGGDLQTLIVDKNGAVWGWGNGVKGALGARKDAHSAPAIIPGLNDVKAVESGRGLGLAIRNDGAVWAWGGNVTRAVGDGPQIVRVIPWASSRNHL